MAQVKGFAFTVDAMYALVLIALLLNLYIIQSGRASSSQGFEEKALLARDKALTAFYRGVALGGEDQAQAGSEYACHAMIRKKAGEWKTESRCEGLP